MAHSPDLGAAPRASGAWATIMIPTRDSAAWIGELLAHYLTHGIRPTLLLDARSRDATRAIARDAGVTVHDIAGFTFTEAIVRHAKDFAVTPWVLWLHDDEFPSPSLFARLAGRPPPEAASSVAIQRRWAWYAPGEKLAYGSSRFWQDRTHRPGSDHHWRLFRPDRVTYVAAMHSEGYLIDTWCRLPPECYIVHFEWVVRTRNERVAKLRRYDAARDGYGRFFENLYLPEDQAPGVIEYAPFETDAFDGLARAYWAARRPDAGLPPPSLRERIMWLRSRLRIDDFTRAPADRAGLTPRVECEVEDK